MSPFMGVDHSQYIEAFILRNGKPNVISLDEQTHLFYFDETNWRLSPVIFVNRNGNNMRMIRNSNGEYILFKYWGSIGARDNDYVPGPKFTDPEKTLNLISVGPARGRKEGLSFLPAEATGKGRPRLVSWRHYLIRCTSDIRMGTFSLSYENAGEDQPRRSPFFQGKAWESAEAVAWCMTNLTDKPKLEHPGAVIDPYKRAANDQVIMEALEDNPLWGAFG